MIEIGKLQVLGSEGSRDAVHVPIVSSQNVQGTDIKAGEYVRFVDDRLIQFVKSTKKDSHGIVDPFLVGGVVRPGFSVAIFLKPGTVTKLIHHFEPSFTDLPHYEEPVRETQYQDEDEEFDSCRGCY